MAMYLLLLCLTISYTLAEEPAKYTSKYDDINYEEAVKNKRTLDAYFKCIFSEGPCTAEGTELKKNLPDALNNECAKCTDKQREGAEYVIGYVIDNEPEYWKRLVKEFNISEEATKKFLAKRQKH